MNEVIRAPRGPQLNTRGGWGGQEAALRLLMNNLDPEVAKDPDNLIVYGGKGGKAARSWRDFHEIVAMLKELYSDETLLIQSGKPVGGAFKTSKFAPRVLIVNAQIVPRWATDDIFWDLEARGGLTMFGQMTAGSWIYIGTQGGILQGGTYETLSALARKEFGKDSLRGGKWVLSSAWERWAGGPSHWQSP